MAARARATKARTSLKRIRAKGRSRRTAQQQTSGCTYSVKWSVLASTRGFTQVWVPNKTYDRAAALFMKEVKGRYAKNLLRARMAPLGATPKCGGTCYGGWCKEVIIEQDDTGKTVACECSYFV
jgi:hypothetical protein